MRGMKNILCVRYLAQRSKWSSHVTRTQLTRYHIASVNNRHDELIHKLRGRGRNVLLIDNTSTMLKKVSYATDSEDVNKNSAEDSNKDKPSKMKSKGELAKVFAEYGTTAVLFHTTISLTSLGISYAAVSSGIDVVALLQKFNLIGEATTEAKIAGGASTFVIAYACHKVFAPVRIFITVTCTPFIVGKLRQIGLLRTPVKNGIDVVALLQKFDLVGEATTESKIAGSASTFVIAYACHKVFMPIRIFITVTCTPFIVRKLRQIGLLKNPIKK